MIRTVCELGNTPASEHIFLSFFQVRLVLQGMGKVDLCKGRKFFIGERNGRVIIFPFNDDHNN